MIFSTWVYHASSGYEPKNMCEHVATYVNISKIFQDCPSLTSASYCASTIWSTRGTEMMKPSAYLLIQDLGEVAALLPSPGLGPLKLSRNQLFS